MIWNSEVPTHHRGRHAEQVDHRRHHDEAAADAHERRQHADDDAEAERQQRADVELRAAESASSAAGRAARCAGAACRAAPCRAALRAAARAPLSISISAPTVPSISDVGAARSTRSTWPSACAGSRTARRRAPSRRSRRAAGRSPIWKSTLPRRHMRQHARHRRGDDLGGLGADRDGRRDADEDQQRRHQEAAADAEQAREEADAAAERQEDEHIDRHLGDRQIDLHRIERGTRRGRVISVRKKRRRTAVIPGAARSIRLAPRSEPAESATPLRSRLCAPDAKLCKGIPPRCHFETHCAARATRSRAAAGR